MKTPITAISVVAILLSTYSHNAKAQDIAFDNKAVAASESILSTGDKDATRSVNATAVNVKALKDFGKTFSKVGNANWYIVPSGGFIANFLSGNTDYRITYNEKGKWEYNLLTYTEDNLPFEVRDLVKSRFYDFDILVCYEYQYTGGKTYIIRMQDAHTIKTLKVTDGEIVSEENLVRSK